MRDKRREMGGSYEMVLWKLKETRQCLRQYQD